MEGERDHGKGETQLPMRLFFHSIAGSGDAFPTQMVNGFWQRKQYTSGQACGRRGSLGTDMISAVLR